MAVGDVVVGLDAAAEQAAISQFLLGHPDVDAYITMNSVEGHVAAEAIKSANLTGKVHLWSFDLGQDVLNDVKSGSIDGAVDQQEYLQGYLGVEFLYLNWKYGFIPASDILTGPFIVNKSNVDQISKLFVEGVR